MRAEKVRGAPPQLEDTSYLTFFGVLDEPVKKVSDIRISVSIGPRRPLEIEEEPGIGGIIQIRPVIQAVVWLSAQAFDRVWTMMAAREIRHLWLAFTEPKRNAARIVSASFANSGEDE